MAHEIRLRSQRTRGATIIELIVAVIILGVGLLPLVLALNKIYTNTYSLGTRGEAQLLAAEKIDELKSLGYLKIATDSLAGSDSVVYQDDAVVMKPFSRSTEISYIKYNGGTSFVDADSADVPTDYIQLKTEVRWATDTAVYSRNLTALLTKEGALELE
ncbi:MAG: hypothetical protein AAB229_00530 [Candidatus Hydrogenedentota bacterium]